ncbi:MAG: rRNA maturation RNase YbeY [Hellea sp.]|nr:rRNA maturation RNase YbeY [Hellea sp.]
MPIQIDIAIEDQNWNKLALDLEHLCARAVQSADQKAEGELSIAFVDDRAIQKLNAQYRGQNKPTNVLSFPMKGPMMGDIVLARETILAETAQQNKSLADHVTHLIVHGFLHLLGFDHQDDEQAAEMESLEKKALAQLGIDNPYQINEPSMIKRK